MADYSNEDFLAALVEAQESARPQGLANFDEWRQELKLGKLKPSLNKISPGFGLMGSLGGLNTNSRAPTGPNYRPSGNPGVNFNPAPSNSKYSNARPNQPPPWISDVDLASQWYSPMEPIWPFGPPAITVPREWNFPVGYNLNYVPQRIELMGMLRGMRQSWGVLSTIIETRKDQLLRLPWTIQVKGKPRASSKYADEIRSFFRRPDGKLSYTQWARKLLDDLFVIDAPTLYMDRRLDGKLRNAQILDGATIFPLIDDSGRRPDSEVTFGPDGLIYERRQPAYQQIIYGLPMINLSEDELIYAMMRPRPELPVFGYSPVEQIFTETTEAIRKTFYQSEYWRSGSIPEMMITVPDQWTPRQIASFQAHFDALLSGQLTLKSKVRFVPGGMKPFEIKNAAGENLWSQRDELLVRLCCYAFSVSPTAFVHQTNRATANASAEAAAQEGEYPLMSWWKDDIMDTIIQEKFGYEDIEFVFLPRAEADQTKQAEIHQVRLHDGVMTINEVREELGLEPVEDGNSHLIYTGAAVVRLDQVIAGDAMMPGAPASDSEPRAASPSGTSVGPVRGPAKPRQATTNEGGTKAPTPVHKVISYADLKDAAAEALKNPNKLQRKLGNYRKGHINLHGLKITIENAKGSKRREKDSEGKDQEITMPAAYGYINGTLGADDMQVDCYLGKHPESTLVWVIDQDKFNPQGEDKGFDEHKVMLAYKSPHKAVKHYLASHYDDFGEDRLAAMTELSYPQLKSWLKDGDMKSPISEQGVGRVIARRGKNNGLDKADTISASTGLSWYDQNSATPRKSKKRKPKTKTSTGPRWLALSA